MIARIIILILSTFRFNRKVPHCGYLSNKPLIFPWKEMEILCMTVPNLYAIPLSTGNPRQSVLWEIFHFDEFIQPVRLSKITISTTDKPVPPEKATFLHRFPRSARFLHLNIQEFQTSFCPVSFYFLSVVLSHAGSSSVHILWCFMCCACLYDGW